MDKELFKELRRARGQLDWLRARAAEVERTCAELPTFGFHLAELSAKKAELREITELIAEGEQHLRWLEEFAAVVAPPDVPSNDLLSPEQEADLERFLKHRESLRRFRQMSPEDVVRLSVAAGVLGSSRLRASERGEGKDPFCRHHEGGPSLLEVHCQRAAALAELGKTPVGLGATRGDVHYAPHLGPEVRWCCHLAQFILHLPGGLRPEQRLVLQFQKTESCFQLRELLGMRNESTHSLSPIRASSRSPASAYCPMSTHVRIRLSSAIGTTRSPSVSITLTRSRRLALRVPDSGHRAARATSSRTWVGSGSTNSGSS